MLPGITFTRKLIVIILERQIIYKSLGASKTKGLNRIVRIKGLKQDSQNQRA
jgi:hypothetical protein